MSEASRKFPEGFFIVFIGPDGSGKSTVSRLLAKETHDEFTGVWHFHWRPGLLPKLGANRPTTVKKAEAIACPPPHSSKYTGIISLMRFIYYWLDFILGYWTIIRPRKQKGMLIIGERYYLDVIVHPERYGFAVPGWLLRIAGSAIASPDLIILLKDDPQAIFARKPELSPASIANQLRHYTNELRYWPHSVIIETRAGAYSVVRDIQELRRTLEGSIGRPAHVTTRQSWFPFPNYSDAKVWVSEQDRLERALNLYHPSSWKGRLVKQMAIALPLWAIKHRFNPSGDRIHQDEFVLFKKSICLTFNDSQLIVSFCPGNPGKHRKTTAQVCQRDTIVAYVKIGRGATIKTLFEKEVAGLAEVKTLIWERVSFPRVLESSTVDNLHFLYLSAPETRGASCAIAPNDHDARFLTSLIAQTRRGENFSTFRSRQKYDALTEKIRTSDPCAAETVTLAIRSITDSLGHKEVITGLSHGDFAPWNVRVLEDNSLYVYDWEYSNPGAPILNDVFHRVFMPARLVDNSCPRSTITKLLNLHGSFVLGPVILSSGVDLAHIKPYVFLYILAMCHREVETQGTLSPYLKNCLNELLARSTEKPNRSRRILVSAYACEPNKGSEPGVGWNWVKQIAKTNETWVITRKNNRQSIETALELEPDKNLRFEYVDPPYFLTFWKRKQRGVRLYYYIWQFAALFRVYSLRRRVKFDIGHHVTFVNASLWTFLSFVPGPYIWGPIGNHPRIPKQLLPTKYSQVKDIARLNIQAIARILDPLYWLTVIRATRIIVISEDHRGMFPLNWLGRSKIQIQPAIGIEKPFTSPIKRSSSGGRIIFAGRFIPMKGPHLAIESLALLGSGCEHANLTLVGEGPEENALRFLANQRGCLEKVKFVKWQSREAVLKLLYEADIFLFPSMEGGGMVVLEAMAAGLPIVCLDYGGPGTMVSNLCGIKVPISDKATTITQLSIGISRLILDPALREQMGNAARDNVTNNYLWTSKSKLLNALYSLADSRE